MKTTVQNWLRDHLLRLVSVQRCTLTPPAAAGDPVRQADLTVLTWAGIVVHIHLIDEPLKPARLKRIVEHATGAGINTLFLVDARLLPRPGQRVPADRWYMAVHALSRDRLYAYYLKPDDTPALRLVDFVPVSRTEVETRGGPAAAVDNLRYFRHTVKYGPVKGYWMLADFEPEAATRSAGFRPPAVGSSPPPPERDRPAAPPTRLEASYALLGLPPDATREAVKAAFRRLAFEVHPDVSHLPKAEAEARFKRLSEAYDIIKLAKKWG
ncbi:MAG: J domain-containing protein [Chloroflexi bacterium]|nr:J domain-containing protein [Chloroflexota bacterium]